MKIRTRFFKTLVPTVLLLGLTAGTAYGAEGDADPMAWRMNLLLWMMGGIALIVLYIAVLLSVKDPKVLSFKYFFEHITGRNAADPETDHEYDGIIELDNPVPAWLAGLFYATIIFAVVYVAHYHVLGTGPNQEEEYAIEQAEAFEKYKQVELPESQLVMVSDQGRLNRAMSTFKELCASCHGEQLAGLTGPNLTDPYWLHGGSIVDVYNTITNGVPGKTMISWKKQISSVERLELASYILSLQGSSPPDPKAPEGVLMGTEVPDSAAVQDSLPSADTLNL